MYFYKFVIGFFAAVICNFLCMYFVYDIKEEKLFTILKEIFCYPIYRTNLGIIIVAFLYLPFDSGFMFIIQALLIMALDILAVIDFCHFFIPEIVIIFLIPLVIINAISSPYINIKFALLSMSIYGVVFFGFSIITKGKFALGDVEMIIIMAGLLGTGVTLYAIEVAMVLNVLTYILIYITSGKKIKKVDLKNRELGNSLYNIETNITEKIFGLTVINGKSAMAFGPFIAISTIAFYFYGAELCIHIFHVVT